MLNLGCDQFFLNPFFPRFLGKKWGCGLCIFADFTRLFSVKNTFFVETYLPATLYHENMFNMCAVGKTNACADKT